MSSEALVPEILENVGALVPLGVETYLQNLVTEWLLTCGGGKTRKAYGGDFREYCAFVQKGFGRLSWEPMTGIGASTFAAWVKNRLEAREIAPATAARKLASVSAFLEFCVSRGDLPRNPLANVKRPRVPKQPKCAVLSDDEVRRLLAVIVAEREEAEKGKLKAPVRAARLNEVVFRTLLGTGCRISELLALRRCDVEISEEHARLRFRAKGAEDHAPFVPRRVAAQIIEFAEFMGITKESDCVFLKFHTKDSAEKRVNRELARLSKKVRIAKCVTPHVLRATVATSLHAKGVPVVNIQRLLNHKDISTTAIYIRKLGDLDEAASLALRWGDE